MRTDDLAVYDKEECAAVVFLHGWGSSSAAFAIFLDGLALHCRVIAPDLPGFGRTPPPDNPWDVDAYADWVLDLLGKDGIKKAILVGHSFGGRIAIKLAVRPDSPLAVDKMVLSGSAGIRHRSSFKNRFIWMMARVCRPLLKRAPRLAEKLRLRFGSSDYSSASPLMRETLKKVVAEDLAPLLPKVQCPTLLVWGDMDTQTPLSDGRRMERMIPNAGLAVFEGCGHYAFLDRPGQFVKALYSFFGIKE